LIVIDKFRQKTPRIRGVFGGKMMIFVPDHSLAFSKFIHYALCRDTMDQNQTPGGTPPTDTPQTPAGPPPVADTPPATPPVSEGSTPPSETPAETPPVAETPSETPAAPTETPAATDTTTPPAEAPSGPPPVGETPATDAPSGPPPADASATPPADPAASTPAPETAPDQSAAASSTTPPATDDSNAAPQATAPASPPESHDKKSLSKPLMVTVGLLMVGAISAVGIVATMKPGDTQSSANTPKQAPLRSSMPETSPVAKDSNLTNLTITSPVPNSTVTTATVTVSGKTFPNAEVFINEVEVVADAAGSFSSPISLDEGENIISVTANDEAGNVAEQELVVTYEM
jgi:hypothetical protein